MIHGYSTGADCASTLNCLRALGVPDRTGRTATRETGIQLDILGLQVGGLQPPVLARSTRAIRAARCGCSPASSRRIRSARRSRATARCAAGRCGGSSSRSSAWARGLPLTDGRPPLTIVGTDRLKAIDFQPDVPSAQVKSCVLFAGLHADGMTRVVEPISTRDHTERALEAFGVQVGRAGTSVAVRGGQRLIGGTFHVPGDISSAAFWMVAAAALPGSDVTIEHVGLNPSRTGIIDVLERMGARIKTVIAHAQAGEPIGTIHVRHADLQPAEIMPGRGARRHRRAARARRAGHARRRAARERRAGAARQGERSHLRARGRACGCMGGEIDEQPDGFHVRGRNRLRGGEVDAKNDHRLAMAFAIAALGATGPTVDSRRRCGGGLVS